MNIDTKASAMAGKNDAVVINLQYSNDTSDYQEKDVAAYHISNAANRIAYATNGQNDENLAKFKFRSSKVIPWLPVVSSNYTDNNKHMPLIHMNKLNQKQRNLLTSNTRITHTDFTRIFHLWKLGRTHKTIFLISK